MNAKRNQHSVRRIVLPSGRTIEVVRFHDARPAAHDGLHICQQCRSELVHPVGWGQISPDQWELELYCPNCGQHREGVFAQHDVAALEEHLDEGVEEILRDLKRLAHANMADEVDRFVAALDADLILPEDF